MKFSYVGVDGCKAGWFCVQLDDAENWAFDIVPDAIGLGKLSHDARLVLIDIPIGLLSNGPVERACDKQARKLLGKRASSVFPAPSRQTLNCNTYPEALEVNRATIGRGLSRQAWNIVPKIREIDMLITSTPSLPGVLRECHPEVCFWALNNQQAMQYNKKKEQGIHERLDVLEPYFSPCRELYDEALKTFLRKQLARDDIIDAMVAAVTAKYGVDQLMTIPGKPMQDNTGLPMEMVYWYEHRKQ
ncbi:MAG: DUF429 domain-containing protein [Gammaproteobacteria bacterium]|nr:MAG: DUF429 domain-containing protein [Gammaproteobacteria bacterium]